MATNYYDILGVDRDATGEQIKKAFRRLARESHPDANPGDPTAETRFREAAESYEVLSDPERRRRYDRGDTIDLGDLLGGFGGIEDLLQSVFGDGGLFNSSASRPSRGRDVLVRVEVPLADVAFGTEADINFTTRTTCEVCSGSGAEPDAGLSTCPDCDGAGQVRAARRSLFGTMMTVTNCPSCGGEGVLILQPCDACAGVGANPDEVTVTVEIPAGVSTGTRLRLSGRGESGGRSGSAGDLFVEISVIPDLMFGRHEDDLVFGLTVGVTEATLGTQSEVPLIEGGTTSLEIPPGTQPGTVFTMRGLGLTRLGRRQRGDLHVEVSVEVPDEVSAEERDLLVRLAEIRGERTNRSASEG